MLTQVVGLAAAGLACVVLAHGAIWTLLSLLAMPLPRRMAAGRPGWRFAVIVPAHNEEACVAETVRSILAARYMPLPEVVVVADNCDDGTAAAAAEAGATVIVREDAALRGKAYALDCALRELEARGTRPDAYAVVDADTIVEREFFGQMARRLDSGATVIQGMYLVTDAAAPVSRIRSLAFALVHYARPLGASRLGLGTGLKGNGMVFRREVLADGFPGSGIAEDAAAAIALAGRGVGVAFEPRALVRGAMAQRFEDARVQDRRWEGGRLGMLPRAGATAFIAMVRRQPGAFGTAADVAALPLTAVAGMAAFGLVLAAFGAGHAALAMCAAGSLGTYTVAGWCAARVSPRDLLALVHVPRFILHKAVVLTGLAIAGSPRSWERTSREARR